ncbi:MAG: hypothetical protein K6E14_05945, partial [Paludibacteraceae bacterium]|nr:hypothetical protein [Paludibacteraceae bacterium]
MQTILIIYSISWLILLAIYLYNRKDSTFKWSEADVTEKFALFFVILFAPIVVLFFPFMLCSKVRDKKKPRKVAEERGREELEEQEYRSKALDAVHQVKANNVQNED